MLARAGAGVWDEGGVGGAGNEILGDVDLVSMSASFTMPRPHDSSGRYTRK